MTVDVLTLGEAMVAIRCSGSLAHGGLASLDVVGSESNVAIGLRRLGHSVRWVSRVGDDPLGELVLRTLRAEQVDIAHVPVAPGEETGLIFFDTAAFGRRRVTNRRRGSAAARLTPADLDEPLRQGARVLHVTGITPALSETCHRTVATTLGAAHEAGWVTSLDVNHRQRLWTRQEAAAALRPLLPWVDVLIASESELPVVADGQDESAMLEQLKEIGWVAVKRGANGASLIVDGTTYQSAGVPVTEADPVGAGDAFTAGLLSGLLDHLAPQATLDRACASGAAAAASLGDWQGLPTREELDAIGDDRRVREVLR